MALLPAHLRLLEDDSEEELTDQQVQEMLQDASRRMHEKQAGGIPTVPDAPFKLPKMNPGHIADNLLKTQGNVTRLDSEKLIDQKEQALANGIKKIEDPIAVKKQMKEVRYSHRPPVNFFPIFAVDDNYPILH
jgi:hypothetical protein